MMRKCLIVGTLLGVVWLLILWMSPITHPPGVLVSTEPEQLPIPGPPSLIAHQDWRLLPLALFTIEARVLSKKRYRFDDVAELSPYDLGLGWGSMSDTAVLERLDLSQSNRFLHWHYWGEPPIPVDQINRSATNVHLIPADPSIEAQIADLSTGSIVWISGYLVEASKPGMSHPWRSSLRRDDTGQGACEIIYVQAIQVR